VFDAYIPNIIENPGNYSGMFVGRDFKEIESLMEKPGCPVAFFLKPGTEH